MPTNGNRSWLPGSAWLTDPAPKVDMSTSPSSTGSPIQAQSNPYPSSSRLRLLPSEATAIKDRIMQEMLALEKERMQRMQENNESDIATIMLPSSGQMKTAEDEAIIRRELNQVDPSAVVFQESWAVKKVIPFMSCNTRENS